MAWVGHCTSHARQNMQSGSLTGSDFFSDVGCPGESINSNTLTGQIDVQMPSPLQQSWSTATLVPCIPSFSGGFTSPLTLCPACSFTTGFFMKSGSMGILERLPCKEGNTQLSFHIYLLLKARNLSKLTWFDTFYGSDSSTMLIPV